jgi:glyoxylase-like metal-dependent hydrolase (beta-lactamase superfamily II)
MKTDTNTTDDLTLRLGELEIYCIPLPTPFPVGPVNVFLSMQDGPVIFDTGMNSAESIELLVKALEEHGVTLKDLRAIVVTHGHRDHMGGLGELEKLTDAPVYAHPLVRDQGLDPTDGGNSRKAFYVTIMREFGVPDDIIEEANSLYARFRKYWDPFTVQHLFADGDEVLGYRVHEVPGHSPSDALFVDTAHGVTVVGDHILRGTNVNPLLRQHKPGEARVKSLVEYRQSLRKSRELDLGICLPGHGDPFDDHVTVIDDILARQDKRSENVLKLVKKGCTTPYALSAKLFPKLENKHLHLGLSMSVGHLEVLEEDGVLQSEHRGGVLHFEPV